MAKFGFKYEVETENVENQGGDFGLMPEMYAVLEVTACELDTQGDDPEDPDYVEAKLVIDVIEPEEFKGRKMWAYWPIRDNIRGQDNKRFFKYGKPNFDRLTKAVGIDGDPEDTDDLLFKQFVAKVGVNVGGPDGKGGTYKDKNEIKKFFFPNEPDKYPEIGVIAGGVTARPATPANDNRAAANTNSRPAPAAAAAGSKPWSKAKAG